MAQVDFSNATLTAVSGKKPLSNGNTLGLNTNDFSDANNNLINGNKSYRIISDSESKREILYKGVFTASGTEFKIGGNFLVSNVSFSSGDTYSFIVTVENEVL